MSIITLVLGALIVLVVVIASVATIRAVLTDGLRRIPDRSDIRSTHLQ